MCKLQFFNMYPDIGGGTALYMRSCSESFSLIEVKKSILAARQHQQQQQLRVRRESNNGNSRHMRPCTQSSSSSSCSCISNVNACRMRIVKACRAAKEYNVPDDGPQQQQQGLKQRKTIKKNEQHDAMLGDVTRRTATG